MSKYFNEIYEYVNSLEIIDTHEHLPYCEEARVRDTDVLKEYLTHYFNRDLMSAGLSGEDLSKATDTKMPIMDRWNIVEPYWEASRNTGYGRSLDISVRELYGFDQIDRSTIEELNKAFKKSLNPGHFKHVLKDKCKIKVSLLDGYRSIECDRQFFKPVFRIDSFICPKHGSELLQIEKESGIDICSLEDFLEAFDVLLQNAIGKGIAALKCGLAYQRSLLFERTTREEAEKEFNNIFKSNFYIDKNEQVYNTGKHFQDYMMHYILRQANKKHLVVQFHTGLLEGSGNIITNSNPELLANLFLEYKNVNFDIFHIGYPYQHVLSALAKTFPNVFIDMCWAHIISPTACVNALYEWLDSVPANKISAFGGDYLIIDAVYGHQYLARLDVSRALSQKVEEGTLSLSRAKTIAEMLFYKNPARIFGL